MATQTLRTYRPATPSLARWVAAGALAGALSVLVFHQGAILLMYVFELTQRVPFPMQPTEPFGVPQLWSLTFWGAVWGALFAALLRPLDGARLVAASVVLGAALPTLVAWFLVAPLKGQPVAAGFHLTGMAFGLIVNGAWGLGTGLGLLLFGGKRRERREASTDRRRLARRRSMAQPDAV